MSAATDAKYLQGWADGKADKYPDSAELAYGADRCNAYERGYIDSGYLDEPREGCNDAAGSKVAQVRSGLDLPDQSQSDSVREAND